MATAFLAAKRSKDPCTQVGACIVNDENRIVGIGYNGMPQGCSDDEFPWNKEPKSDIEGELQTKYMYGMLFAFCFIGTFFHYSVLDCRLLEEPGKMSPTLAAHHS